MSAQIETNINVEFISRDRISVLFRLILVAPIAIFSSSFSISDATNGWPTAFLVLPALLALVFREVYPSYVLNFNKALLGLTTRIVAFVLLLQDGYPSIESDPRGLRIGDSSVPSETSHCSRRSWRGNALNL